MAKMGNWGSYLKFETSDRRILTFNGFKRDLSARTVMHVPIGAKPMVEFLGSELQNITFTISVNAGRGMPPRKLEKKLLSCIAAGKIAPLVIGKRNICSKAMLVGVSEAFGVVLKRGELYTAQFDITMMEYR